MPIFPTILPGRLKRPISLSPPIITYNFLSEIVKRSRLSFFSTLVSNMLNYAYESHKQFWSWVSSFNHRGMVSRVRRDRRSRRLFAQRIRFAKELLTRIALALVDCLSVEGS